MIESEPTTRLQSLGIDYADMTATHPGLIHAAVTPYGRQSPESDLPATDLTMMAAGGPVWNCGYDDHTLPPTRGWGRGR